VQYQRDMALIDRHALRASARRAVVRGLPWLSCLVLLLSGIAFAQTTQTIAITAVTNSADFQPGLPQKGSLASIFVTGLQGAPGAVTATQYPLSNTLNGISVWINFLPAPILAIAFENGYQQINVQVPWEGQRDPLYVEVFQNEIRAHTENTQANGFSVFFSDANGYGVVQHATDYSAVTTQNPAHPGEYLIAYGINLGPVSNTPSSGAQAPSSPLAMSIPPGTPDRGICGQIDSINVGAARVVPSYVGLAPGVVGVYQINFQLPTSVSAGDLTMSFARTLISYLFGPCMAVGNSTSTMTSRSVLLPIR
jgi:uncharacterized protein (TIGR03437 family)